MNTTPIHDLQWLNSLPPEEATNELLKCCGSRRWACQMANEVPFLSYEELKTKATNVWWSLAPDDWLEAFRSHPKIGEKKASASSESAIERPGVQFQKWSEQEQAGVLNARLETMGLLAELNRQYEEKFGYIFIVCATGWSSEEMLALLQHRLKNEPAKELSIAAAEQVKITELRLNKLLAVSLSAE